MSALVSAGYYIYSVLQILSYPIVILCFVCSCFTTEILEGFDVQRTSGLADTLRKYGYLTQAITHSYRLQVIEDKLKNTSVCPPFNEFIRSCNGLDKMTVSDVFAIQLMQVLTLLE